jgi:hypothetical protein
MAAPHETAVSPELLRLIEAHRVANAPFDEAYRRRCAAEDVFSGFRDSDQDKAREALKCLVDADREVNRVSYRCASNQEAKAKASYILAETSIKHWRIRSDFLGALLESMA